MAIPSLGLFSFLCSLLLLIIFTSRANAANNTQNFHYFCDFNNKGNYTANSTYHTNLSTLLSTLISNTEIDYGFYNFSHGQNSDKVNAIGLCRGDVKPNECRSCLSSCRANLTQLCPNQKEAIGWYEDERCMLRYSDRSIFGIMENGPAYYVHNEINASDVDQFNQVVQSLLDNLTSRAASGDPHLKYAAASAPGPNFQTVYGLVQCTPDLSESECSDCLSQSIARIPIDCCEDKIGGRVVRPSCNMRFETSFLFYGPTAAPPPPPSTTTTTNNTSQGKSNTTTGIAIGVPIVVVVMVLIFICIYLRVRKPKKKFETQEDDYEDDEIIEISESLQFKFGTIQNATNDFSDYNKLGQGGFGVVYRVR